MPLEINSQQRKVLPCYPTAGSWNWKLSRVIAIQYCFIIKLSHKFAWWWSGGSPNCLFPLHSIVILQNSRAHIDSGNMQVAVVQWLACRVIPQRSGFNFRLETCKQQCSKGTSAQAPPVMWDKQERGRPVSNYRINVSWSLDQLVN